MSNLSIACMVLLTTLAGAAVLEGCKSQSPVLSSIFVPLPPSTPIKNPPRHPPPPKPEVVTVVTEEVVKPPATDWNAIYQTLPRDKKEAVDWMRALTDQMITLKPGIAADATPASTKEDEVQFVPKDKPTRAATFRHATHTQWLSCKNCHPTIFKKKDDNLQFTHDEMDAGKYCGACHFKVVVVQNGCYGCHPKKAS